MSETIRLEGCRPEPLAYYLKALAVLRLVAEQADSEAAGFWEGDVFCLDTKLTPQDLLDLFMNKYKPTPIVVPWSGSDFFGVKKEGDAGPYDKTPTSSKIIEALIATNTDRLEVYRETVCSVLEVMKDINLHNKSQIEGNGKTQRQLKAWFISQLRTRLTDTVLPWIDATSVADDEKPTFNNLLGSGGGSDGNSHFSDNFMQCLWMCLPDFETQRKRPVAATGGKPFDSVAALDNSLFASQRIGISIKKLSPALFNSQAVGGPNATSGFQAESGSNPWDYILMLEGACVFAGAMSKKIGSNTSRAAFPFLLEMTKAGFASATVNDSAAKEIWLPMWEKKTPFAEVQSIFSEGRAEAGGKVASRGLDMARAVSQYGVDRGLVEFSRTGIVKGRVGGENYNTAISLGRWKVNPVPETNLISEIDGWLDKFRRASSGDNAPASIGRALRDVESAIMELCRSGAKRNAQALCIALGKAEQALARSSSFSKKAFVKPIPLLSANWLTACDDNSLEFRLASALASAAIRENMEPVRVNRWVGWDENDKPTHVVWGEGRLTEKLISVLERRIIDSNSDDKYQAFTSYSSRPAELSDIAAFIRGEVDETRLEDLLWGLNLIDWRSVVYKHIPREYGRPIPLAYSILKLCFLPGLLDDIKIPVQPAIIARAKAGDASAASRLSSHRLTASGFMPRVKGISEDQQILRRCAAALLFPINREDIRLLAGMVLQPTQKSQQKGGEGK